MTTRLLVMNEALRLLREPPLGDADDPITAGRTLRDAWEPCVRSAFERGNWNFALKRAHLAEVAPPAFGYAHYFQLEADHMRTVGISEQANSWAEPLVDYREEAGKIATNAKAVYIVFVSQTFMTRIGDWSQRFADYVAADLAYRCPNLNTSDQVAQFIEKERKRREADALGFDAMQDPPYFRQPGSWQRAQRGYGLGRGGRYGDNR